MLKRLFIIFIILGSIIFFSACQNKENIPTESILTPEDSLNNNPDELVIIDQTGFFRRINPAYFQFSWVIIEGKYNVPSNLTRDEKQALITLENQKLFDQSMLETEGHTLSYFVSKSSKMIILSYQIKEDFLLDLELLKNLMPYANVEVNLNTVDDEFILSYEITAEVINQKVNQYQDYVDTNESISFSVHDLIKDYRPYEEESHVIFPTDSRYNVFIHTYQEYLTYYPHNTLMLNESDFEGKTLLLMRNYKATEDIIKIKAVYVTDQVTVVFEVEAMSNLMPSVLYEYVAAVMVQTTDLTGLEVLKPLFHTHYQSGFLAQVPFGIRP